MNKSVFVKKVLPSLLLFAAIACLAVLSFLPVLQTAPAAGISPSSLDSDALSALSVCRAYLDGHSFETELNGSIRAKAFGVPYTQKLYGGRAVDGNNVCERGESASALVKAAVKTEFRDGKYSVYRGSYKNKAFVYGDSTELSRSDYYAAYGRPVTGLVKFELDGAIVGAQKTGDNTYVFTLDPSRATVYSRCAVRTTLGTKNFPEYELVEFTLVTDGARPESVTARERFKVDKLGGTLCDCTYTEKFIYPD